MPVNHYHFGPDAYLIYSYEIAVDKYDLRSLTNVASGAAPLSLALANKFLGRLKSRGVNIYLLQGNFYILL